MDKEKPKITYKEFMRQLDAVREKDGRIMYEELADEFANPKSHKTH